MIRLIIHIICLAGCLALSSCGKEVAQEELIQSAVEIKLGQYRTNQLNECKENAYRNAEDYVDSLLVAISLETKLDTIPKASKPDRPPKPLFKNKPDSIKVDRIYKKEE